MEIRILKDRASVAQSENIVAGAIAEYNIITDFSSEWNGLTIKAIFSNGEIAYETAVMDNNVIIPQLSNGKWYVGFVGYAITDEVKTKQISTNLIAYMVQNGSGELETETQEVPEPSVWEQYIATMNSILAQTTSARDTTESYKDTTEGYKNTAKTYMDTAEEYKNDAKDYKDVAQDLVSAVTFSTFFVNFETGKLCINTPEKLGNAGFSINKETGKLEVRYNV